ncbi:MAG: hypothetical protein DRI84_04695 [Bacteroidetes bacterium]|nr:MAG: hypothetical protein DRI84_04695 [Bacteroidota bacterium]
MGKKLRKLNRATHRDVGYFFVAMIIVYSLSGIAINHIDDWDPSYVVNKWEVQTSSPINKNTFNTVQAKALLEEFDIDYRYRKFYFPNEDRLKVFFKGGSISLNIHSGNGRAETLKRRTIFHAVNWLHYNPNVYWKWFSDIFAVALILLSLTGLFILKGKNGLKWRGTILMTIGIIIPLIFLMLFYF